MESADSITEWIAQLKARDPQASHRLWGRYVDRLVRLARKKLNGTPRAAADEEDVVLSAFHGFFRGVEAKRFPRLDDRDDLWQVLVMLTDRKSIDHRRRELAARRGGGAVRGESAFAEPQSADSTAPGLSQVVDGELTPEFAAECAEQFEKLLAALNDKTLQQIAVSKMEGYTNEEVACEFKVSLRSIERKLSLIRRTWEEEKS
jgi:DNA-directed RNA polymerase specialized sigma24 family protein